ncbi:MAG: methylated-DNA--[protein]-cysteine S-methyltransferase, partial [Pseudomonadota bacterium]
ETFLSVARRRRLAAGFGTLAAGGKVIEAQLDAGFASPSAFRVAFARLVGRAPGDLPRTAALRADRIETPLGDMIAVGDDARLHLLEFLDRKALPRELAALVRSAKGALGLGRSSAADRARAELDAYFAGRLERFETPLAPAGTPFQTKVWKALTSIPVGETLSYGDLARRLSRPEAHRAVAAANGANRIAIMIPCHRLVGADGALTGYGGGLLRKRRLLEMESARARAPEEETP